MNKSGMLVYGSCWMYEGNLKGFFKESWKIYVFYDLIFIW